MNHDTVNTSLNISEATLNSIRNRFASDERLTTSDDHEVISNLSVLTSFDLSAKALDSILSLNSICTEKRILLQAYFILNDNCRYAKTLKSTYGKYEVLEFASSITVIDKRLSSYLKSIIQAMKTSSQINSLNIGLTFRRRIRE